MFPQAVENTADGRPDPVYGVEIRGLTKTYPGGVRALAGIDLSVPDGMFGLLGPNGAGKSTLMKIIATLLDPDRGAVTVGDCDVIAHKRAARRLLGYLPQDFGFYPSLTAEEMLGYFARLKGIVGRLELRKCVETLLDRVNLFAVRKQRVGEFSGGMTQRLGIAQALIGSPRLIIVDEPTAGLDPEERARFHSLLAELANDDTVVLLSTHIVSDVSALCSRMAVMREGAVIASTTPRAAIRELEGTIWEAVVSRERANALRSQISVVSTAPSERDIRVRVHAGMQPAPEFISVSPTLEDYYFTRINAA